MAAEERLVPCSALPEQDRLEAAKLAAEAMSSLYQPLGNAATAMLAGEFLVEGSELGDAVALHHGAVEGMIASYPAEQYSSRQRVSFHHALGHLDRESGQKLIEQLRLLAGAIPQDGVAGEYVARFAVRDDLRGTGVADRLMNLFIADHPHVSLHVRADNSRAIGLYRRHGFAERGDRRAFLLMARD